MPTIQQLRAAFPTASFVDDSTIQSPWFHIGTIRSGLLEGERLRLSLAVIEDALASPKDAS